MFPVVPSFPDFLDLSQKGNVVPVYAQLASDFETPLSAFVKIVGSGVGFIFESAEMQGSHGRYSILGGAPRMQLSAWKKRIHCTHQGVFRTWETQGDVLCELESIMAAYKPVVHGDPPPFYGGAIGYLGYDATAQFEPSIGSPPADDLGLPDALFLIAQDVVIFDHYLRRMFVVSNAFLDDFDSPQEAYADAQRRIVHTMELLEKTIQMPALNGHAPLSMPEPRSNMTREYFENAVEQAKHYIHAGDIFQLVVSQRFELDFKHSSLDLYRALRHVNPSPYMFILQLGDFSLVGSSPEVHVRCVHRQVEIRPIAGTRWRGKTQKEDDELARELLSDEKERAEHVMLVDLARNDLGRVCKPKSIELDDWMTIERYSHVMHIVSHVHGTLEDTKSAYDALRSTFPAGTVSGAPKIRAMQILNTMESSKRGSYAGAIGYMSWEGNHDSCIALRTCLLKDGKAYVQAGAGIVADSDPVYEYEETKNKAKALMRAIALANTLPQGG